MTLARPFYFFPVALLQAVYHFIRQQFTGVPTLMFNRLSKLNSFLLIAILLTAIVSGCSVEAARTAGVDGEKPSAGTTTAIVSPDDERSKGSKITIEENSPADTVRVFYKSLREKRVRQAMYLTNMRPAMEGLTDTELKEFQVDFDDLATRIPNQVEINGEIISGDTAIVTANLPDEDAAKLEVQKIKLRRENGVWVILTVDKKAEAMIRKEGKNYFYALRIDTHETEAQKLLQKIADVQGVMASKDGKYQDMQVLVEKNLLPADILSSDSTGYNFAIKLKDDNKSYFATATPAVYGKTGKLSFLLEMSSKGGPRVLSKDLGGQPLKK
jgi:hypothetical protein